MFRFATVLALTLAVGVPAAASAASRAPSAASVSCAPGDQVVWINTRSNVYHTSTSSYYGKTSHGKYACLSDAMKSGAHAAKREGGAMRSGAMRPGTMSSGEMNDEPSAVASPFGRHHHHKKHHGLNSPAPEATR